MLIWWITPLIILPTVTVFTFAYLLCEIEQQEGLPCLIFLYSLVCSRNVLATYVLLNRDDS